MTNTRKTAKDPKYCWNKKNFTVSEIVRQRRDLLGYFQFKYPNWLLFNVTNASVFTIHCYAEKNPICKFSSAGLKSKQKIQMYASKRVVGKSTKYFSLPKNKWNMNSFKCCDGKHFKNTTSAHESVMEIIIWHYWLGGMWDR